MQLAVMVVEAKVALTNFLLICGPKSSTGRVAALERREEKAMNPAMRQLYATAAQVCLLQMPSRWGVNGGWERERQESVREGGERGTLNGKTIRGNKMLMKVLCGWIVSNVYELKLATAICCMLFSVET